MQITVKKIRPYIKVLLLTTVIAAGVYIFFFLKNDFYSTFANSQTFFTLQKNITNQIVNINEFNDLVDKISQKTSSSSEPNALNDPFK